MSATVLILFTLLLLILVPLLALVSARDFDKPQGTSQDENGNATVTTTFNGVLSTFIKNYFSPLLENMIVKLVIIAISVAFFVFTAVWAFTNTEVGLELADIATDGSYQWAFVQTMFAYKSYPASIITYGDQDMSSTAVQNAVLATNTELQASRWVSKSSPVSGSSWFANGSLSLLKSNVPLDPNTFYASFNNWISSDGVIYSANLVCKNNTDGTQATCGQGNVNITTSSQSFMLIDQDTTESMIDAIRDTRTRADKAKVNGKQVTFVYGYTYALWEQYLEIKDLLYTICGYTLLGIALATLACQMSPESSFFICLSILIINIECYGAMSLLGLKLNAFSVVNLCISVGLAVEFTAHFSRAFLVASGDGNMRMRAAFAEVGSPMFCGALSTFLSISWFAASNLKFIRIYYFNFFATITLIAFWNGTFFLPVVLSLVGPQQLNLDAVKVAQSAGTNEQEMKDEPSKPDIAIPGITTVDVSDRRDCCSIDSISQAPDKSEPQDLV